LVWPDNSFQPIKLTAIDTLVTFSYTKGLPMYDYNILKQYYKNNTRPVEDVTHETNIQYKHRENSFPEFEREPLLPHMLSTEGPALVVADFNKDGLDDVFLGSSRGSKAAVFIQQKTGKFIKTSQPDLESDSNYEFVASCAIDVNNDGFEDLVVAN